MAARYTRKIVSQPHCRARPSSPVHRLLRHPGERGRVVFSRVVCQASRASTLPSPMTLRIFNTLTRQTEVFTPIDPDHVRMYVCGITIYDFCHVGHARMMVAFD